MRMNAMGPQFSGGLRKSVLTTALLGAALVSACSSKVSQAAIDNERLPYIGLKDKQTSIHWDPSKERFILLSRDGQNQFKQENNLDGELAILPGGFSQNQTRVPTVQVDQSRKKLILQDGTEIDGPTGTITPAKK